MCTVRWLSDMWSCHCDDSFYVFKKKKKKYLGRHKRHSLRPIAA